MAKDKIGVGIIGLQPGRSWAATAHVPALKELPDYKITALSTTKQASADAAAKEYGIAKAFDNHQALVNSPDVDLVVVGVKVPHHLELTTAAIEAGKDVYCEWPLGNGIAEAEAMNALAKKKGVRTVIGLQARVAPTVRYAKDLVAEGFVGEVLSTSLIGTGGVWGEFIDAANAYGGDKNNGATLLTIPFSHTLDAMCFVLGQITELTATMANRRKFYTLAETGEKIPKTAEDQVAASGLLQSGAVFSAHYRGGADFGTGLLWEIHGTKGVLRFTGAFGHAQIADLELTGATAGDSALKPLAPPDKYYATSLRGGPGLNVAEVYAQYAADLKNGTSTVATFDDAIVRHKMAEAVMKSAETGTRQKP